MELKELREPVRRNLINNDLYLLDIISTGHNLIKCLESENWERLQKKTSSFIGSYNGLIDDLNKKDTPNEDLIIELQAKIEALKNK